MCLSRPSTPGATAMCSEGWPVCPGSTPPVSPRQWLPQRPLVGWSRTTLDHAGGEAIGTLASGGAAASKEPAGPEGSVDTSWLPLERLEDLVRAQEDPRDVRALDAQLGSLDAETRRARRLGARSAPSATGRLVFFCSPFWGASQDC